MKKTLIFICSFLLFGCVSLSVKDYNPFDKDEKIVPEKDQIEVKYKQNISSSWETEVTLGPEAEYINVGFIYRPYKNRKKTYLNHIVDELDEVVSKKNLNEKLYAEAFNTSNLWANVYSFDLTDIPISFRWQYENQPSIYALNILNKRLCWYLSMQMLNESKSTTLNTQRNFFTSPEKQSIQDLKDSILLFPYLTASHLETTTNALEYTELLISPAVWE
ncbi:MAG: hypothetical protein PF692_10665 [Kiritimatiellae bacterium]|jgi:hypothetical protein|nr:hypothetical protein [Kiritimatiellia bacterium]